jgi:hypothetical protein
MFWDRRHDAFYVFYRVGPQLYDFGRKSEPVSATTMGDSDETDSDKMVKSRFHQLDRGGCAGFASVMGPISSR